jgi:hypothetical protein
MLGRRPFYRSLDCQILMPGYNRVSRYRCPGTPLHTLGFFQFKLVK